MYLFAEVLKAFDILGLGFVSLASLTGVVAVAAGCGGGGEGLVAPLASELLEPWWTRLLLLGPAPDVDMEQLKISSSKLEPSGYNLKLVHLVANSEDVIQK